jgi:hypothetical protein
MVAVVAQDDLDSFQQAVPEPTVVIGRVVSGRDVAIS